MKGLHHYVLITEEKYEKFQGKDKIKVKKKKKQSNQLQMIVTSEKGEKGHVWMPFAIISWLFF